MGTTDGKDGVVEHLLMAIAAAAAAAAGKLRSETGRQSDEELIADIIKCLMNA